MAKRKSGDDWALRGDRKEGESEKAALARTVLRPSLTSAVVARSFSTLSSQADLGITELVEELSALCKATSQGDLSRPEAMLTAQAHALDAIFSRLANLSSLNMAQSLNNADRLLRLALKAQSQCRATLETLAAIKNPPVVIARQANIAHGPQQVNNGEPTRTREFQTEQSKLLEQTYGERLDTGAAGQTIDFDPAMATVGEIHRPEKRRG